MVFSKSLTQVVGKPTDTDRTRSLQGDEYHVTGFVEVSGGEGAAAPAAAASAPPVVLLYSSTTDGEQGKLLWEAADGISTFNLGEFFTIQEDGDIEAAADCLVHVDASAAWSNGGGSYSPAGTRHLIEVTNLWTPALSECSDVRHQHTTPYQVITHVSVTGFLKGGPSDAMWVTASHNAGPSQGLEAYVAVTLVREL
jgi:hypothetical protein